MRAWFALSAMIVGCGSPPLPPVAPSQGEEAKSAPSVETVAPSAAGDSQDLVVWADFTRSPGGPVQATVSDAAIYAICGAADVKLAAIAARGAKEHLDGSQTVTDELPFMLHAAGEPHVWARAWQISGGDIEEADLASRVRAWVAPWATSGVRRCGIGRATGSDRSAVYLVAVDALADLDPIPTSARVGQWISFEGKMLVPASDAHVVLLGPHGAPKTVVATLSGGTIRSRFAVDQPGPWLVQILATVATGPRPVLEAMIFAGTSPPTKFTPTPAPGESAAQGVADDDEAMFEMINAARASEQLPALARDPALDALARAHSEEMRKARMIGHDVGGGDPSARAQAAGYSAHVIGENVANAGSLEAAHRVLWASPSHRGNLLLDRYKRVGVAVVRADGLVWVTEMFAG